MFSLIPHIVFAIAHKDIRIGPSKIIAEYALMAYHCIKNPFIAKGNKWSVNIGDLSCVVVPLLGFGPYRAPQMHDPISGNPFSLNADTAILGIIVKNIDELEWIHHFIKPLKPCFEPPCPKTQVMVQFWSTYDYPWIESPNLNITMKIREKCEGIAARCGRGLTFSVGEVVTSTSDALASTCSTVNGTSGGPVLIVGNMNEFIAINHGSNAVQDHYAYYLLGTVIDKLSSYKISPDYYYQLVPQLLPSLQQGFYYRYMIMDALIRYGIASQTYFKSTLQTHIATLWLYLCETGKFRSYITI
eukprot:TRINITY_DN88992_c0_g1_i1.p1 TRINITY_DN88992_c0_g1~~TRINITY_DN88992_c0_g1_i1.p1  ORF type:complete len:301 (-),score=-2.45 TRINITY_DN88992_c0_g1_i1:589-1491(-)